MRCYLSFGGRELKSFETSPESFRFPPKSHLTSRLQLNQCQRISSECSKQKHSKVVQLLHHTLNMHSTLVRVQSVFGFFTSAAFAVAAAIAFSVLLIPQAPSASLELKNVQVVKGRPHYYSTKREEYAHVKFDLDAGTCSQHSSNQCDQQS
jgi:hypothetical protein